MSENKKRNLLGTAVAIIQGKRRFCLQNYIRERKNEKIYNNIFNDGNARDNDADDGKRADHALLQNPHDDQNDCGASELLQASPQPH
jgi:hypothetical protein